MVEYEEFNLNFIVRMEKLKWLKKLAENFKCQKLKTTIEEQVVGGLGGRFQKPFYALNRSI